jgi:hypothetical protein
MLERVLPSARLVRLAVDTPVALEAFPLASHPDELFHIGTISGTDRLLWQGLSVRPDMLMLEEGEIPSRFAMPAGCELLVARLDRRRIESLARILRGPADEPAWGGTQLHPGSEPLLAGLRVHLRALARGDLVDPGEQLALAEDDLYERVASMLAAAPTPVEPSPGTRRRALRRAEPAFPARAPETPSRRPLRSERLLYRYGVAIGREPVLDGAARPLVRRSRASPRPADVCGLGGRGRTW